MFTKFKNLEVFDGNGGGFIVIRHLFDARVYFIYILGGGEHLFDVPVYFTPLAHVPIGPVGTRSH